MSFSVFREPGTAHTRARGDAGSGEWGYGPYRTRRASPSPRGRTTTARGASGLPRETGCRQATAVPRGGPREVIA